MLPFRLYFCGIAERSSDEALMCLNPGGGISEIVLQITLSASAFQRGDVWIER